MRKRAWWLFLLLMAPIVGLYLFGPEVFNQGPVFNGIGLSAVVAIVVGVRLHRPSDRRPWYLFAVGQALFVSGDDGLTDAALRDHLRATLPRTSVPRHCFVLPRMPLSDGGKVDWRALRATLSAKLDAVLHADAATPARQNAPGGAAPPADLADRVARVLQYVLDTARDCVLR